MITLETKLLSQALDVNSKNLGASKIIPMYETILFQFKGGRCDITTSDGISEITTYMKIEDEELETSFCIDGTTFFNTVKLIDAEEITMKFLKKVVNITAGNSKYKLPFQPAENFPRMKGCQEDQFNKLPSKVVSHIIHAGPCINANDTRVSMTGVNIYAKDNTINVQGTDASIIFHGKEEVEEKVELDIIVNRNIVSLIDSFRNSSNIEFASNDSTAVFRDNSVEVKVRLVASQKYPDTSKILANANGNNFTINRIGLIKTIKRAMLYSNQLTKTLIFKADADENSIQLSAENIDFNRKSLEELTPMSFDLETMRVGVNASFLITVLNTIEVDTVKIFMKGERSPIFITDAEGIISDVAMVAPFILAD